MAAVGDSAKGVFPGQHGVITPGKRGGISERLTASRAAPVFEIRFKEAQHLIPGLGLRATRADGCHVGHEGVRLSVVDADFVRNPGLL